MTRANEKQRGFGANIVERILPHRRPFLFVDRVKSYRLGEVRFIEAALQISVNDPVFDGHFPNWSLWPGVYVVEGLGQTAQLLATLDAIRRAGAERHDQGLGLRTLDVLDAGYSLRPSATPSDEGLALLEELSSSPVVGLATRIDMRFLEPVLPGCRLDYRVEWTLEQDGVLGFDVEASVGGRPVARGELGASVNTRIPRP
jgi:3-hydroxymyristoyl/3-hydroxydecanoyl-(acyl carrier protein) dehydratase